MINLCDGYQLLYNQTCLTTILSAGVLQAVLKVKGSGPESLTQALYGLTRVREGITSSLGSLKVS